MRFGASVALIALSATGVSGVVGWSIGRHEIARRAGKYADAVQVAEAPAPAPYGAPSVPVAASPVLSPPAPRARVALSDPKPAPAPKPATRERVAIRGAQPPVTSDALKAETEATDVEFATAPSQPGPAPERKGGVLVVVSLPSQRAYVFKDGQVWGSTRISTGKRGKRTPVGRFTILEKQKMHHSRKYDNAPMPFMQRLTWGGVAMHAGRVPGYPASHGCIRLPRSFAKRLYGVTNYSSVVVVTNKRAASAEDARKLS